MDKKELGIIEDTLFVPMLGRIYASEYCRSVLYDEKALALKPHLPENVTQTDTQTQYTYLASATRSANMDRSIKDFLSRKPNGVIAQLGCGLETTFYRNDDGHAQWYGVDLPHVIEYRRSLLPETKREHYIAEDAFEKDWLLQIRKWHPSSPLLITASGLLYYFEEDRVITLIRMLQGHGDVEFLFDTVNKNGMVMMRKKHMKTVGHTDAQMFFCVDSARELTGKVGGQVSVLKEEDFYRQINKSGLHLSTKASMIISDLLHMVKIIHLELM